MKKILIVDDDEGILDAVSLFLESEGYSVATLARAQEIETQMKAFKPDLILLDVLMSGIDGRDICRTLKASKTTKKIPVIMISAHPSAEKGVREVGADDFLPKPFESDDLLKKIGNFLPN